MKTNILFLSFALWISQSVSAQLGYWCSSRFVELKPDESSEYIYVQAVNNETQKKLDDIVANMSKRGDNSSIKLNKDRYYISSDYPIDDEDIFRSIIYKTSDGFKVMVLPRIVVSLHEGITIDRVLNLFDGDIIIERHEKDRYILACKMNSSEKVLKAIKRISEVPGIKYFEPEICFESRRNNTYYSQQYYLNNTNSSEVDINVVPAWNITTGSSSITVAVVDEGVEHNHEDIGGRVLNGYTIRNSTGYGEPQNEDESSEKAHGTACAGIIAATNNNIGIRGIASNVKILPINIEPDYDEGLGTNIEIADAILWTYPKSDVISCSFSLLDSDDIHSAINSALTLGRNGKGCVFVAASGNYGEAYNNVSCPARYSGVIAVGAVKKDGTIWPYSQGGNNLDVVAPSGLIWLFGDVVTTDRMAPKGYNPNSNYTTTFGGTSAACPQVAGVAALMLSVNPNLTNSQVTSILQSTASDLGSTGFDTTYGYGLVDAFRAVCHALPLTISGPTSITSSATYSVTNLPSCLSISWSLNDSYYNQYCLQQNSPSPNQCTITNSSNQAMSSATLTATIKYGGSTVRTLTKNQISATGIMGSYYNGYTTKQLNYPSPLFMRPNSNVSISSSRLIGATVSFSGSPSSVSWSLNSSNGLLLFNTANSGNSFVIHVDCSNGDTYNLSIVTTSSSNQMNILSGDGRLEVGILPSADEEMRGTDAMDNYFPSNPLVWTLEVYNATTGEKVFSQEVDGTNYTIDTTGWRPGVYVVRAIIGDEVLNEKIVVK